jgi:hypothetical protein
MVNGGGLRRLAGSNGPIGIRSNGNQSVGRRRRWEQRHRPVEGAIAPIGDRHAETRFKSTGHLTRVGS